jgi:hypothetical protein
MKRRVLQHGAALMLLLAATTTLCAWGDEPSLQDKVKAAFVFNFMQFTEWPAGTFESADSPIVVGFVGESAMADAFRSAAMSKTVNGRAVLVKQIRSTGDASGCEVIVIPGAGGVDHLNKLGSAASGAVLTIGDAEGFSEAGGVMQFYLEDGKERFEVNTAAAERAHLQISSKLLKLARIVRK